MEDVKQSVEKNIKR